MDGGHYTAMVEALAEVPDPRAKRGVRYSWGLLLTLVGAAMVAGNRHGRAIGQWVGEHARVLGELLGSRDGQVPSEATLRRVLRDVDVVQLEACLARLAAGSVSSSASAGDEGRLRGQAMDGKRVRGCGAHGRTMHLLSVAGHGDGAVLAQVEVGTKENEAVAAPGLLGCMELCGTVTTMDAMLAQREIARQILGQGGHYLMVVKENQPGMREAIAELFEVGGWMASEVGTRYWR